jgi:hypothetical protein
LAFKAKPGELFCEERPVLPVSHDWFFSHTAVLDLQQLWEVRKTHGSEVTLLLPSRVGCTSEHIKLCSKSFLTGQGLSLSCVLREFIGKGKHKIEIHHQLLLALTKYTTNYPSISPLIFWIFILLSETFFFFLAWWLEAFKVAG